MISIFRRLETLAGTSQTKWQRPILNDADREEYFAIQQRIDNSKFWARLGGKPNFSGSNVLEVGCGLGAMSIDIAASGAGSVLGIDLNARAIEFARWKASQVLDGPAAIRFEARPIATIAGQQLFDMVVSKDTFEHVITLEDMIADIARLLRPGGRAFIGFSPLYNSPFGDHGELGVRIPWLHLIAGEARVVAAFNRTNNTDCHNLHQAGFNGYPPRRFYRAFRSSGLATRYMVTNPGEGLKGVVMAVLRAIGHARFLEKYVTIGIYAVLEKPRARSC
jgi:SAM-dependent methyltransferase